MKDKVAEVSLKLLLHTAVLYSLFVHFHGEESAGGGFQAGAIFGSVFLVYQFVFDDEDYLISEKLSNIFLFIGIMLYFGYGVLCMLMGGKFLEYNSLINILPLSVSAAAKIGIMIVETGVFIVVSMGMLKMGYAFKRIFDKSKTLN
jgi:multicomponent Na+:H+ antiporter subunit B